MSGLFFEDFHSAARDFPYFDPNMKNINYISHFHAEVEIISVRRGEVGITSENGCFTAETGDICIFMPGEIHSFSSLGENHLYIMKIHCINSVEKVDFSALRFCPNIVKSGCEINSALSSLIEKSAKEIQNKALGYAYAANSLSNSIICEILRCKNLKKIDASLSKRHLLALSLLESVNSYIENHYKEPISLSDISKFCNFSEYYFAHFFKEITQTTFLDFLTTYRLEKAVGFLLYSHKNITETAFECGFSNTRAFNRAFKKKFNMTPTDYMKTNTS